MITIDIDVDIDNAIRFLDGMERRAKNFRMVFEWARLELAKSNAENFTASGLPAGGWSPRTRPYAWPIMRKTDQLFRSLASLNGSPNEVHTDHAIFGTNVEYAKFHQYGTTKMAARKIVFEPRGFASDLGAKAARHVVGLKSLLTP